MDSKCAWDMRRSFIENVELEKIGAGSTFSVKRLDKGKLFERWRQVLGPGQADLIESRIVPFLKGFQMYFAQAVETEESETGERGLNAVMVGPQTGFIPDVMVATTLYDTLINVTRQKLNQRFQEVGRNLAGRDPEYVRLQIFLENLHLYKEEGYHCWSRLRDGTWSTPPDDIGLLVEEIDRRANLANAFTEQLSIEVDELRRNGVLSSAAIADNGWRFEFKRPSTFTKLWYVGYPEILPTAQIKIWKDKKGRKK